LINRKSEIKGTEKPNLRFNYCNTNYVLLALLIEKVTGVSYPEYVQQSFFIPLDMQHSFVFTLRDTIRMTPSFDVRHQLYPLTNMDFTYGDKNIYSTAKDLLKWDQGIRNGAVVNQQTLDSAFTPQNHEKPGVKNYGLGWRMIMTPNGKKVIYHNGWWHGNNSVFMRLPDENATIILIGNVYNRKIYSARELIPVFNQNYLETETSD
jgi:CubicO group peptidase (beta-lactamase class C family)